VFFWYGGLGKELTTPEHKNMLQSNMQGLEFGQNLWNDLNNEEWT
jgi:hypothetical protein